MKEVKKKIFNIKTWHFWKSYRCFVCSVVGYVARTTIYKYIFVLRQYPCHNGILFPYTYCHFVQPNSNTVFSIYLLFSQNGFDVVKKCLSGTLFPSPISKNWAETFTLLSPNQRIKTGFNFDLSFDPSVPSEKSPLSICWVSSDLETR